MTVHLKKELDEVLAILESTGEADEYTCRILEENEIPGIAPVRTFFRDGRRECRFVITGMQPLEHFWERRHADRDELKTLLETISSAMFALEEYLISPSHVVLSPETVFVGEDVREIRLCCHPAYCGDFYGQIRSFMQYVLEKIDHTDEECVILAYELYRISGMENYSLEELLKVFENTAEPEDGVLPEADGYGNNTGVYPTAAAGIAAGTGAGTAAGGTAGKAAVKAAGTAADEPLPWEELSPEKAEKKGLSPVIGALPGVLLAAGALVWILRTGDTVRGGLLLMAGAGCLLFFFLRKRSAGGAGDRQKHGGGSDRSEVSGTSVLSPASGRLEGRGCLTGGDLLPGRTVSVDRLPFMIGKQPECALCLDKPVISRIHAGIEDRNGVLCLLDYGSTNGTWLNGERVQKGRGYPLSEEDEIRLADFILYYRSSSVLPSAEENPRG